VVPLSANRDLPELLIQAEEKSSALRREVRAVAKAAAYAQFEDGLVQSAVVELSARKIQEQQRHRCRQRL
jgi:hypothetical protein